MPEEPPPALYDFALEQFQPEPAAWSEWEGVPLERLTCTVFDTETTGFAPGEGDEIVSIGAVRIVGGRLLRAETFERLVDPGRSIPRTATAVHGITRDLVRGAPTLDEVWPAFAAFAADSVLVGHNVAFDMAFLAATQRRTGTVLSAPLLDTLLIDGVLHPDHDSHTLEAMAERLGVNLVGRHTALGDALLTGEIFLQQVPLLVRRGVRTLGELRAVAAATAQARTSARLYRT
jgi:DNA polymerase-3 subunit epsilon